MKNFKMDRLLYLFILLQGLVLVTLLVIYPGIVNNQNDVGVEAPVKNIVRLGQ